MATVYFIGGPEDQTKKIIDRHHKSHDIMRCAQLDPPKFIPQGDTGAFGALAGMHAVTHLYTLLQLPPQYPDYVGRGEDVFVAIYAGPEK